MPTDNIVPTPDQMQDPSYGVAAPSSTLGNVVSQPAAEPLPPVNGPSRLNNVLARIAGTPPPATPSASSGGVASGVDDADNTSSGGGWKSALGKGLQVLSTGLSGVPAGGRPSFLGGLGQGARADQAAQAAQQEIKFRTFDDQVRAANLHNQDLQMQQQNEDQQDARQAAVDFQTEAIGKQGGTVDTHPNDGTSVMQTLQAQTAANGAATITPGTHISPNGKDINIPANDPPTMAAQLKNYKDMVGIMPGLPSMPNIPDPSSVKNMSDVTNARANVGKAFDIFTHLTNGHNIDGSVYTHQQLNNLIPAYQAQIDSHAAKGDLSEYQMGTLKNTLTVLQADEQNHSDKEQEVSDQANANAAAKAGAVANAKLPAQIAAQDNAASNKPQKIDNTSVVAFDPDAPGLNGSKGANVVMPKAQADAKGLYSYKANPEKLNGIVAGVNDVQTKINALADASADMSQVDPSVASTLSGNGIGLEYHGVGLGSMADIVNSQGRVLANKGMNEATRNYIVALAGAHEAITQLPRLQTMGASSRVTQTQMEQAAKMLPVPGDDSDMANAKLQGLQNTIDPIRKQIPSMPGASMVPSFRENAGSNWSRAQRLPQTPAAKAPVKAKAFDYSDTM